jgi:hypothetical protein
MEYWSDYGDILSLWVFYEIIHDKNNKSSLKIGSSKNNEQKCKDL